ncbi:MAG: hypothetical protein WAK34_11210 [Rhodoplanes sp.]
MKANDAISAVASLAKRAYNEFSDVLDFIWKSPRLIDHEYKLETKKLEAYFPLTGNPEQDSSALKYRQMRWALEGNKLESTFPYLIALGNLFASVSLFETYCLMLCKFVDSKASKSLINCKGSGISKLFNFFIANGVELKDVSLYQQVRAALKIRNTLFSREWAADVVTRNTATAKHSRLCIIFAGRYKGKL